MANHHQAPVASQTELAEDSFKTTSSTSTAEYRIRSESNHLFEDPDIEDDIVYRVIPGGKVTQSLLEMCAKQLLSVYGAWSGMAALKAKCLPDAANNILVIAMTKDCEHIGHCFVSQWIHDGQRIWWITQLLVLKGYRNQKRATKVSVSFLALARNQNNTEQMLKALTEHYDVGRLATQTDTIGVISVHPYTICAVLRVFGRGIEHLPSKPDWMKMSAEHLHTPFSTPRCALLMKTAPVKYLNTAIVFPGTLIARTNFYLDFRVARQAMQRIVYSMNKQVPEPWEWLFGSLEQGCEYVCVLDYRDDPHYTLTPRTCGRWPDFNGSLVGDGVADSSTASSYAYRDSAMSSNSSSNFIPYPAIDRYLLDVPFRCILEPSLSRTHATLFGSKRKRIHHAKELIAKHRSMIPIIMGAKSIPVCLRRVYQAQKMRYPLPGHMKDWTAFTEYMYECYPNDINVTARVIILQAIHFQELLDEHERVRQKAGEKMMKDEKMKKKEEKKKSLETGEGEPVKSPLMAKVFSPRDAESMSRLPLSSNTNTPPQLPARYKSGSKPAETPSQVPMSASVNTPPKLPARYRQTPARMSRGSKTPCARPQTAAHSLAKASIDTPKARSTSMLMSMIPLQTSSNAIDSQEATALTTDSRIPRHPTPRTSQQTPQTPSTPMAVTTLQQTPSIQSAHRPHSTADPYTSTPDITPPRLLTSLTTTRYTSTSTSSVSHSQRTAPRNFSHPFSTPSSCAPSRIPHYMAPTTGSLQRYKAHSPTLFYSSDESDTEHRSNLPERRFPKNSSRTLDRTHGERD